MDLDVTVAFVPVFWGTVAVLLVLAGALLASIDPEIAEVYLGQPSLLFGSAAAVTVALAALLLVRPGMAHGLATLWPY
ncbi:MAG: hypothetical protein U0802_16650 [Candidatus Binatia bacterium]